MLRTVASRRQVGSWRVRSARPLAISRAARISAIDRFGASPQASSWAGESRATASGEGTSRNRPQALRGP
jgi:hypothetical protein